jgi:hypothetical protein
MRIAAACLILLGACDAAPAPDPCAACSASERCERAAGETSCQAVCVPPSAPRFTAVPRGTTLVFPDGTLVSRAREPSDWVPATAVALDTVGTATVHARWQERPAACPSEPIFSATYEVVPALPHADEAASAPDAVHLSDPRIAGWASGWVDGDFGADLDAAWTDVELALGPATGAWDDAVSLGNGGALTFTFERPLADGPGLDLAVFENGFSSDFLELAFVEVSSDGESFARFPSLSLQAAPVAAYGTLDASQVLGLAGRFAGGYGTGFDLAHLADDLAVVTGRVDLGAIAYVRIVDLVGDGVTRDSFGAPLYDPTPTFGPAGFDVEAIATLR